MLPRQLTNWFQKGDGPCLRELQGYMYDWTPLSQKDEAGAEALLAALKRAAGQTGDYNTFLPLR